MRPRYKGLTWDHPRGVNALRAAASAVAPGQGFDLTWDKQPLEGFESHPIADLCARYDLVVLDHPHVREAVEAGCLLPLEELFGPDELATLAADSIGRSFHSYCYADRHCALPLDAATQVMAYRPDLVQPVTTWDAVARLAETGGVALSLAGPHAALSFLSIAPALGEPPAERDPTLLVSSETGRHAFELLTAIRATSERSVLALNPIGILGHMATHDDVHLCPLVYGYVNYTRPAKSGHAIRFANALAMKRGGRPGSTLGGTGIGISRRCVPSPELLGHLRWLLGAEAQSGFIPANDGQPSRRSAWHDTAPNAVWGNFYAATAPTLEAAYVRPRYAGYTAWQAATSAYLRDALANGLSGADVAAHLNATHGQAIGDRAR